MKADLGITVLRRTCVPGREALFFFLRVYSGRKLVIGKKEHPLLYSKWFQVIRPPYLVKDVAFSHKLKKLLLCFKSPILYTTASKQEAFNYDFGGFANKTVIEMSQCACLSHVLVT